MQTVIGRSALPNEHNGWKRLKLNSEVVNEKRTARIRRESMQLSDPKKVILCRERAKVRIIVRAVQLIQLCVIIGIPFYTITYLIVD
jgi:hypothetical protein